MNIESAISQFRLAAIEKGAFGGPKRDDELHHLMVEAIHYLRAQGGQGRAALKELIFDDQPTVRAWSCAELLSMGDEDTLPILRLLSATNGVCGFAATMVLQEYQNGSLKSPFG